MKSKCVTVLKNRGYSNSSDFEGFAVVRVHNVHLANLGGRNAWVTLVSSQGKKVHRVVKGCGKSPDFAIDGVEFDYETFLDLDIPKRPKMPDGFHECNLELRRTRWFEKIAAHWHHPDPAYRYPIQLSLIGFIMGVIGLVLGIISLF
jgi:hypothetical protein